MAEETILKGLYPFLHGSQQDPRALEQALLESVRGKALDHQEVMTRFVSDNQQAMVDVARAVADVYRAGGRLLTMGNGGSSCDASHVAVEFLHPVTTGRPSLPAIDLAADRAMITGVANDIGFQNVFVRQLIALSRPGDAVLGLSTSGNSDNLVKAFEHAKRMGLVTIGLVGKSGGEMSRIGLDHCLLVHTDSIHRIQECHVFIYHVLWDLVHTMLADGRGAATSRQRTNGKQVAP